MFSARRYNTRGSRANGENADVEFISQKNITFGSQLFMVQKVSQSSVNLSQKNNKEAVLNGVEQKLMSDFQPGTWIFLSEFEVAGEKCKKTLLNWLPGRTKCGKIMDLCTPDDSETEDEEINIMN